MQNVVGPTRVMGSFLLYIPQVGLGNLWLRGEESSGLLATGCGCAGLPVYLSAWSLILD